LKPFLRATDRARLAPVGWTSEPAGVWAGREVEVVYDPRQHQIVMVRNEPGDTTRVTLAGEGFRRLAVDGQQEMWVRDHATLAEQLQSRVVSIQAKAKAAQLQGRDR
jgi:hypothetical protein